MNDPRIQHLLLMLKCPVCGGIPHASGIVCICGGTGSIIDAEFNARSQLLKYQEFIEDVLEAVEKWKSTEHEYSENMSEADYWGGQPQYTLNGVVCGEEIERLFNKRFPKVKS